MFLSLKNRKHVKNIKSICQRGAVLTFASPIEASYDSRNHYKVHGFTDGLKKIKNQFLAVFRTSIENFSEKFLMAASCCSRIVNIYSVILRTKIIFRLRNWAIQFNLKVDRLIK